jgi:hypothetical protein
MQSSDLNVTHEMINKKYFHFEMQAYDKSNKIIIIGSNQTIYFSSDFKQGEIEEILDVKPLRVIPNKSTFISVLISNTGFSDCMIPAFEISAINSILYKNKFPNEFLDQVNFNYQFFAFNDELPFMSVPPKYSYRINFIAKQKSTRFESATITLKRITYENSSLLFFDSKYINVFKPAYITSDIAWTQIFKNLINCYGQTYKSVYKSFVKLASVMHENNQATQTISSLVLFAIRINDGYMQSDASEFISETDHVLNDVFFEWQFSLSIVRTYSTNISKRKLLGLFGYGWSDEWYYSFLRSSSSYSIVNRSKTNEHEIWVDKYNNTLTIKFSLKCTAKRIDEIKFKTIFNSNKIVTYIYDENCTVLTQVEYNNNSTINYRYNNNNDLIEKKTSLGFKTNLNYDSLSQLLTSVFVYLNDTLIKRFQYNHDCFGFINIAEDNFQNKTIYYNNLFQQIRNEDNYLDKVNKYQLINKRLSIKASKTCELITDKNENVFKETCKSKNGLSEVKNANGNTYSLKSNDILRQEFFLDQNSNFYIYNYTYKANSTKIGITFPDKSSLQYEFGRNEKKIYNLDKSYLVIQKSNITNLSLVTTVKSFYKNYQLIDTKLFKKQKEVASIRDDNSNYLTSFYTDEYSSSYSIEYDRETYLPVEIKYPDNTLINYEYNKYKLRTKITTNYGYYLEYVYNEKLELIQLKNEREILVEFSYLKSKIKTIKYSNNYTVFYEYFNAKNMLANMITMDNLGNVYDFYKLKYDENNNIIAVESKNFNTEYKYDLLNQIIEYKITKNDLSKKSVAHMEFKYDKAANRIQTLDKISNKRIIYNVNNVNRYVNSSDGSHYSYDQNGNLILIKNELNETQEFIYDSENTLIGFKHLNLTCYLSYINKAPFTQKCSDGTFKSFLVDPFGPFGYNVITINELNETPKYYYHATEFGLFAMNNAYENFFFHSDIFFSIVGNTNEKGKVVDDLVFFDPFGNLINGNTKNNIFSFQGRLGK